MQSPPAAEVQRSRARLIVLVLGPLLLACAGAFALQSWLFVLRSARTDGTVTEMRADYDDQNRVTNFAPVFTFTASDGRSYTVLSHTWSNPPAFSAGERVPVRYLPDDPQNARIARFWQLWSFPVVFALVGSAFAGASLFLWVDQRRKTGQRRARRQAGGPEIPGT